MRSLLGRRFMRWVRRTGLLRKLVIVLAVAAVASGVATYAALSGSSPFGPDPRTVLVLLLVNLILLLTLGAIVARRLVELWIERRRGAAGSLLHSRMVAMFSLVAVTPAIIIAVFAALFFNFGIEGWFSERVRTALSSSSAVAEAYLEEHKNVIRADILAMANDLNRAAPHVMGNRLRFDQLISTQAGFRSLPEAVVIDRTGQVLARSRLSFGLEFEQVPTTILNEAVGGEVVLFTNRSDDRLRAVVRLDSFLDAYLFVGRFTDPRVIGHVERNRQAKAAYERLEGERSSIQITFALIFIVVSMLLLLVAVWLGLSLATRLVRPIGDLIAAAEQVRAGNLEARVPEQRGDDEIGKLSRSFNRMTTQLGGQRAELVEANRQLDDRRRFTETVLSGVSAGVIGLDIGGHIDLPNRSAAELLDTDAEALIGHRLVEVAPEMNDLVEEARHNPDRLVQGEVNLERDGGVRNLLVRVASERSEGEMTGFVVTFDDITDLVVAQRTAAWADVARRIAHEIKNPLTPIQLAAERLKRKYLKEVKSDPDIFSQCTDTIIRHAVEIGGMVDEFSSFARMPAPVFKMEDLTEIAKRSQFLQQLAHSEIEYREEFPCQPVLLRCDARQISQVLTNLFQNSADAIGGREDGNGQSLPPGRIEFSIQQQNGTVVLKVEDNGCGLPEGLRDRLTEPYVTTREKGTGLGLAIVKKIIDDHGGRLMLDERPGGGTRVQILFAARRGNGANERDKSTSETDELASHGS